MLAYPSLAYLHCALAECQCVCVSVSVEVSVYVVRMWWKCQCVSVRVEVSVFKGFSGRTLRNAFGKNHAKHLLRRKMPTHVHRPTRTNTNWSQQALATVAEGPI